MRFLRVIVTGSFILLIGILPAWAAVPAADHAPFMKKDRQVIPADKLRATYKPESIKLPPQPWKIPTAPLDVTGRGIALYYLIPYKRVQDILPETLQPYPGPEKIWFRVDILQWTSLRSRTYPGRKLKKFVELAYRFEVSRGQVRGTYPLRIYMDSAWPVLWTRYYGGYDAYPLPRADVNFSPFIHFFQLRRGKFALVVVDIEPRQGMGARMTDLFSRRKDIALWQGDGKEFTAAFPDKTLVTVVRRLETEIKNAEIKTLLLTEPVKWKILSEQEVSQPNKVLLLESVLGTWIEEPQSAASSEKTNTDAAGGLADSEESVQNKGQNLKE